MQTLIIGRLMVIFLLLVASWTWNSGRLRLSFDQFPQDLFLVFLISVGLTIIYFFLLRLNRNYPFQIKLQFALDALSCSRRKAGFDRTREKIARGFIYLRLLGFDRSHLPPKVGPVIIAIEPVESKRNGNCLAGPERRSLYRNDQHAPLTEHFFHLRCD